MKKLLFLIFTFTIFSGAAFTQGTKEIDALLVKKDSRDTLNIKIKVVSSLINKKDFDEISIAKHIIVIDTNDKTWPKEKWYKHEEVDYLEFRDFKGNRRVFSARQETGPLRKMDADVTSLYEIIYEGSISMYKRYSINSFDGSIKATRFLVSESRDKPIMINSYGRTKKQLIKLTKDTPKLKSSIKVISKERDIIAVLKKYDGLKTKEID